LHPRTKVKHSSNCTKKAVIKKVIHTPYSTKENEYINFNSVDAINKIADIDNEYFQNRIDKFSRYYGTVWRKKAEQTMINDSLSEYQFYINQLNIKSDSLHCTLYAYEGLKAGLTNSQLTKLENIHQEIWKSREIAGWSLGYILVKHFNWNAYLLLHPNSNEYQNCINSFNRNQTYPVWKQPNIPLKKMYIIGESDSLINNLLNQHEFGWGFSEQGIHTWITRYNQLKECNWLGVPALSLQTTQYEKPLFITTTFSEYFDYNSHIIVFPPKEE